jgi:hypothetical protein
MLANIITHDCRPSSTLPSGCGPSRSSTFVAPRNHSARRAGSRTTACRDPGCRPSCRCWRATARHHERTHTKADVAVRGPAADLLLVLTRRRPLDTAPTLELQGDRALFEHWIGHMDWVTNG